MAKIEKGHRLRFRVLDFLNDQEREGVVTAVKEFYDVHDKDGACYRVHDDDVVSNLGFVPKFKVGDWVRFTSSGGRGQITGMTPNKKDPKTRPTYRVLDYNHVENYYAEERLELDHDLQAVVVEFGSALKKDAEVVFRFAVGDKVKHRGGGVYSVGTIKETKVGPDRMPRYLVDFCGAPRWNFEDGLILEPPGQQSPAPPWTKQYRCPDCPFDAFFFCTSCTRADAGNIGKGVEAMRLTPNYITYVGDFARKRPLSTEERLARLEKEVHRHGDKLYYYTPTRDQERFKKIEDDRDVIFKFLYALARQLIYDQRGHIPSNLVHAGYEIIRKRLGYYKTDAELKAEEADKKKHPPRPAGTPRGHSRKTNPIPPPNRVLISRHGIKCDRCARTLRRGRPALYRKVGGIDEYYHIKCFRRQA